MNQLREWYETHTTTTITRTQTQNPIDNSSKLSDKQNLFNYKL
jgi:hypothetical protein